MLIQFRNFTPAPNEPQTHPYITLTTKG